MNKQKLIEDIRTYCKACVNEAIVKKYSRFFKEGFDAYGLSQEQVEIKVKELLQTPGVNISLILKAAPELLETGKYEETSFVLLLLNGFEKEFSKKVFEEIGKWFSYGICNWAHADTLGMFILPKFISRGIIAPEYLKPWISSKYKYQRRTVPVALIKSLKTSKNFSSFFRLIQPLMTDSERVVHQGVGWFLREAWKLNRERTEGYLFKWKDKAPRLIFQYATEKMTSKEKKRFRRER
jgi:3-methyladenine DNA glycosylase AlkD